MSLQEKETQRRPLMLSEVKQLVHEKWAKDLTSLTRDQKRLFEYLAKFVKTSDVEASKTAAEQIMNELGIDEEDVVMLVNVMPETRDELRPLLFRSYPLLDAKAYNRMLEILKALREGAVEEGQ